MSSDSAPSALAAARASDLARLREQFAFEGSATSAYALAKGLWQNGLYDEAFEQFTRTRDMAPRAPDAGLSLIRAAIALGRLHDAKVALEQALANDPDFAMLLLHKAQLLAGHDPAAARDVLAPCRSEPLCALFHDALDALSNGQPVPTRSFDDAHAQAMWSGLVWLAAQQPRPRIVGTAAELLRLGVEAATLEGLVLECGVQFGRTLAQLATYCGQRCHGFDSFTGAPSTGEVGMDDPLSTGGVVPQLEGDIVLHPGWFKDTLPAFLAAQQAPIRLLHIDVADAGSTGDVLDSAAPWLREGSVIVFGHLIGFPGSEAQAFSALQDHAARSGQRWDILAGVLLGREVALRVTAAG